jgi:hypothetical protein
MNLLDTIINAGGGAVVQNMSQSLGIGESQTQSALGQLLPAVARAMGNNASSGDGLRTLLGALGKGNHQQYLDNPQLLGQSDTVNDGNNILGHLFGSKDVSRKIATRASANTGVGADILKKMLPMGASVAMGALSQKAAGSGMLGAQAQAQPSGLGGLSSFLDFDGDGSIADDLLGIAAKKFFG